MINTINIKKKQFETITYYDLVNTYTYGIHFVGIDTNNTLNYFKFQKKKKNQ